MILYHAGNITNIKSNNYNEIGIHMGTKDTASKIADVKKVPLLKYNVDIKNPLRIIDFARWEWYVVSKYLYNHGIISESEFNKIMAIKDRNKKDRMLISILKSKGYDAFEYDNYFEGGGLSYVIFDKNQISKPLTENQDKIDLPTKYIDGVFYHQTNKSSAKSIIDSDFKIDDNMVNPRFTVGVYFLTYPNALFGNITFKVLIKGRFIDLSDDTFSEKYIKLKQNYLEGSYKKFTETLYNLSKADGIIFPDMLVVWKYGLDSIKEIINSGEIIDKVYENKLLDSVNYWLDDTKKYLK